MSEEIKVKHFINLIKSYNYWTLRLDSVDEQLEEVEHQLMGVGSPRFTDLPKGVQDPYSDTRKQKLRDRYDELRDLKGECIKRILEVDSVLYLASYQTIEWFRRIYIKGESMLSVAEDKKTLNKLRYAAEREIAQLM